MAAGARRGVARARTSRAEIVTSDCGPGSGAILSTKRRVQGDGSIIRWRVQSSRRGRSLLNLQEPMTAVAFRCDLVAHDVARMQVNGQVGRAKISPWLYGFAIGDGLRTTIPPPLRAGEAGRLPCATSGFGLPTGCDPRVDALLQQRQRHRAFGEDRVVECTQIELRTELLLGARAQFDDLHFASL